MKIVIDIPKEMKEDIDTRSFTLVDLYGGAAITAIQNGVPLPENHGRLVDADKLFKKLVASTYSEAFCVEHHIDYSINLGMVGIIIGDAETIIDAE